MRNLSKMHYQLYMWLYCFQNYKMVTVNITLIGNLTDKHEFLYIQATFYL